ncbi:hypothetical protein MHU86_25692 [Fragilaria crotonensis]|nr:hypothetical protein MHU86_25692 [Fragilaria crotonensis]
MGAAFLTEAMHQSGIAQSQPAFAPAPQAHDMSTHNPYGLFGQQLPQGVHFNDSAQILQPQALHQQNQHLYQLAHGQDLSHLMSQQQQQQQQLQHQQLHHHQQQQPLHRHFERRTESEFEPRPLEEMPPQYHRQWK